MDYKSSLKQRSVELRPGVDGKFQAEWQLTDAKLMDAVRVTVPPTHAIPIIFVPGIMGSNLCDSEDEPVWLLNGVRDVPMRLAWKWYDQGPGERQSVLHPERTRVYRSGAVPSSPDLGLTRQDYHKRGWGEVSEASYHKFLLWLDHKMNGERDPMNWEDFSHPSLGATSRAAEQLTRKLAPGLVMKMHGLPAFAEKGVAVDPVTSDELLKRSKSIFPVYAFGYNWLASNQDAARSLKSRIEKVITENNAGPISCTQVILITHSMGGLVARACNQLPGMTNKIVGIVHGVMPATGAAVAYRRCKVGMRDEDFTAALVIGSDGQEVTAVFAQSPGALQLLPSEDYGEKWLQLAGPSGQIFGSLPASDPYDEIYLQRNKWWGLIREEWLRPKGGISIDWDDVASNIRQARDFHRSISKKYHHNTYVFYGGGQQNDSFTRITWNIRRGSLPQRAPAAGVFELSPKQVRTDGSNNLYVGGERVLSVSNFEGIPIADVSESSFWEVHCAAHDSPGDGTVPARSGKAPRLSGGSNILQQFEVAGIQHEPAYRDCSTTQQITYYAITKLAAAANLP
jgi:pimeloyl-ACP methyl ester carboxylesterase